MEIAPQANEGNENIDGTKIYMIRTPLARWIEESIVLDGPYVHDTVLALKSKITEPLEKQYESELQVALAKKTKEDEERKKKADEKARQEAERVQAAAVAAATAAATSGTNAVSSTTTNDQQLTDNTATTTTEAVVSLPSSLENIGDISMTSPDLQRSTPIQSTQNDQNVNDNTIIQLNDESAQISLHPSGAGKQYFYFYNENHFSIVYLIINF